MLRLQPLPAHVPRHQMHHHGRAPGSTGICELEGLAKARLPLNDH